VEVHIIGVARADDGTLEEDGGPSIILRIPGNNSAVDNPPFFAGG
jgi:hypothetical protein